MATREVAQPQRRQIRLDTCPDARQISAREWLPRSYGPLSHSALTLVGQPLSLRNPPLGVEKVQRRIVTALAAAESNRSTLCIVSCKSDLPSFHHPADQRSCGEADRKRRRNN
jgi:hypothetical protein